jgi:hypothetical protein
MAGVAKASVIRIGDPGSSLGIEKKILFYLHQIGIQTCRALSL